MNEQTRSFLDFLAGRSDDLAIGRRERFDRWVVDPRLDEPDARVGPAPDGHLAAGARASVSGCVPPTG